MRSEKEVYDIVLNFAKTDKRIRMVTLEGSRTNTNIPPDDFQDFDITFFVTDMDSFNHLILRHSDTCLRKRHNSNIFNLKSCSRSCSTSSFCDSCKCGLTCFSLDKITCNNSRL